MPATAADITALGTVQGTAFEGLVASFVYSTTGGQTPGPNGAIPRPNVE